MIMFRPTNNIQNCFLCNIDLTNSWAELDNLTNKLGVKIEKSTILYEFRTLVEEVHYFIPSKNKLSMRLCIFSFT